MSLFHDIQSRELYGLKVRKRPYFYKDSSNICETGVIALEHNGEMALPLAISFCKSSRNAHIVALSDEEGYVNVFNSSKKFPLYSSHQENAGKSRLYDWVAHHNSVFDICWIKGDTHMVTASGDQTIKVWDLNEQKCTAILRGHSGSVKSLSPHSTNPELLISGSRDGSFALWDLRCRYNYRISAITIVKKAHMSPQGKRVKGSKVPSMSITSVLYLKDEVSIATAGADDGLVKFWDTRHLKTHLTQISAHLESSNDKGKRLHAITSLSQDSTGSFLSTSCMDNIIYLYDVLRLEKGPIKSFSGCQISSFFVKAVISPDASHILSGSSDKNAYIWEVNKPDKNPIVLEAHAGEVASVDWCPNEATKIVTSSDDYTVRFWNAQSLPSYTESPSAIRRRIMAAPAMKSRRLFCEDKVRCVIKESSSRISDLDEEKCVIRESSTRINDLDEEKHSSRHDLDEEKFGKVSTPQSKIMRSKAGLMLNRGLDKSPECDERSPCSVLNHPPSSKKRTILDYFSSPS